MSSHTPPLTLAEFEDASRLGLCGFPLPEQISRVSLGARSGMLPHLDAAIARQMLERRLTLAMRFAATNPDMPSYQLDVADTRSRLGDAAFILGEHDRAAVEFKAAVAVAEAMNPLDPQEEFRERSLFTDFLKLALLADVRGRGAEAVEHLGRAESALAAIVRRRPGEQRLIAALAKIREVLSQARRNAPDSRPQRESEPPDWAAPKPGDADREPLDIFGLFFGD